MNQQAKSILSKAIDNPDITLAILGCALSIPLTLYLQAALHQPILNTVGIICFISCLAYLVIRRKSLPSTPSQMEAGRHIYLLLNILFFCLLTYSIVALYLRPELYVRPLGYFIAMAAMTATLAIEILFLPSRQSATYFALFKIILIGLSLEWSQLLIYPSIVGIDPWYHQMFTTKTLDVGYIPLGYAYSKLPCFNLMIGATSLVTGLSYKMATMFSVCFLQVVCDTLFIFLLGKFIHSPKAGALSALLLGVANYNICFGYWTIPNTMAVVFIPIIIYLLFKVRQEKPTASICLAALFMAALILTHAIGALCLAMLLFLIWVGFEIYKRLRYQAAASDRAIVVAFVLFTTAMLCWWTFGSGHINLLIKLVQAGFSGEYFGIPSPEAALPEISAPLMQAIVQYRDSVPFAEQLVGYLGLILFFALAFLGCFAMLHKSMRNRHGFALVIGALIILIIAFFGIITRRVFEPVRWAYTAQILLAIPLSVAILWFSGLPKRKIGNACLLGIMTFVLSFLMVMCPEANLDNRTFSPNTIVRYAFTKSEIQAADTVSNIYNGAIGSDWYVYYVCDLRCLPNLDNEIKDISEQLYTQDFSDCQDMFVLIREEVIQHPFNASGRGKFRLNSDPQEALTQEGFSKVYDCGSVSGFFK